MREKTLEVGRKPFLKKAAFSAFNIIVPVFAGLLVGAIIIALMGENVLETYGILFKGGFGTLYFFLATLTRSVPIILCALGAVFAWRAGYINIGGEGQLVVGGFMTTVAGVLLPFRGVLGIVVALVVGVVCGAIYALIAAFLDDFFNVFLLITTLLMNYVANHITAYYVNFPLKDNTGNSLNAKTVLLDKTLWLPRISTVKGSTFNAGFIIMALMAAAVIFIIYKTVFGYESRMSGLNKNFAEYGGVKRRKIMYLTMMGSGALCALGGSLEVLGVRHLYMDGMLSSSNYAWTGLMAALIADLNPVATIICAIFLAGLQTGGAALERNSNLPLEITTIIQAVITLFVSVKLLSRFIKNRQSKKTEEKEAEGGEKA